MKKNEIMEKVLRAASAAIKTVLVSIDPSGKDPSSDALINFAVNYNLYTFCTSENISNINRYINTDVRIRDILLEYLTVFNSEYLRILDKGTKVEEELNNVINSFVERQNKITYSGLDSRLSSAIRIDIDDLLKNKHIFILFCGIIELQKGNVK